MAPSSYFVDVKEEIAPASLTPLETASNSSIAFPTIITSSKRSQFEIWGFFEHIEIKDNTNNVTDIQAKCPVSDKLLTVHHSTMTTHLMQHTKSNSKGQGQPDIR